LKVVGEKSSRGGYLRIWQRLVGELDQRTGREKQVLRRYLRVLDRKLRTRAGKEDSPVK